MASHLAIRIGRDGLLTSSSETFKPPVKPNVSTTKTGDVNAVFDSGFTRMPKGKAQDFRSVRHRNTLSDP